jgi:alanine-glyoxylate transaminase / serine-glyoxylate transaminase / serine-pyruvate transaminase
VVPRVNGAARSIASLSVDYARRMTSEFSVLPPRVLMGPGPSPVPASVLSALGAPTVGHLDPAFLALLDELRAQLRVVFGTTNTCTLPMSGTGSAGMETCVVNLIEPGDRVLVGLNGAFGVRLAEVAKRAGAEVVAVEQPWGRSVDAQALERAAQGRNFKALLAVHAETSTGVLQPLAPLKELADKLGALFVVDTVTSLGGVAVDLDRQGIDASYSGTQKCLACPPGLAPVSFSSRALQVLKNRTKAVQSWYLDLTLITQYWGQERVYHHTAPVNMLYALHEALRLVLNEGLDQRFARHRRNTRALHAGLEALGLELPVPSAERLPPLTLVKVPDGVDEARVRRFLLEELGLEVGGGLGQFKGRAWRIGLMGAGSTRANVTFCLSALERALAEQGWKADSALQAADEAYRGETP